MIPLHPPMLTPPLPQLESGIEPLPPTVEEINAKKDYDDIMLFLSVKNRLTDMITAFNVETAQTKTNWETRFKLIETEALRKAGKIPQYAHMIPVRAIDSNIRRQQPAYVNYLKQSRRLAIFKAINNPSTTTTLLEDEFTRGMTYSGWEIPFFKCIDGAQTHGWDWLEVIFDRTKPFHVGYEHIGHDRLIFPLDSHDIQACEIVLRSVTVTSRQLKIFIKDYSFNAAEVDKIIKLSDSSNQKERSVVIYKKFCKYNGIVYVSWFWPNGDDWLLAPQPLFLGRRKQVTKIETVMGEEPMMVQGIQVGTTQVPTQQTSLVWEDEHETEYPIFLLPYNETAQLCISQHHGRVFMDKPKQEARTANLSQFLSGCQLASTPVFSVDKDSQMSATNLEQIEIGNGKIIGAQIKNADIKYPDSVMLKLQNYLDTFDSQEAGQTNYAANNRQDSRKTATEVQAAREDSEKLSNVEITLFSKFLREVWTFTWAIVQNRAVQGLITLLVLPETGKNNVEFINQPFDVRSAGDIDVIKKTEMLVQYKEFWAIIKDTPIALQFLAKMLILAFPEDGNYFAEQLMAGDPRILVGQLVEVLKQSIDADELAGLTPENMTNLQALIQQAEAMTASVQNNSINGNPAKSTPTPPATGAGDSSEVA